jgi:hypothetical protein
MPSASLLRWRNDRAQRLGEVETQCAASLALTPPQPNLVEENLRGGVLLLSAHFQGFCRDARRPRHGGDPGTLDAGPVNS